MSPSPASFDYVVVGSGSSGSVLAARLSEDPDVSVLLVEAGSRDDADNLDVPIAAPQFLNSAYDWASHTDPEPGLDGRVLEVSHGRVLGGSSSINSMTYLRGSRRDYDGWAAGGASGWDFEAVLPYFRRSESNERLSGRYHGVAGPLSVSDGRSRHPLSRAFLDAAQQAGYRLLDDLNVAEPEGVGYTQVSQRGGRRCSVSTAYLAPAAARPNLRLLLDAHVLGLCFDAGRAVGVDLVRGGTRERYRAEREVLLAAGAYHTPQLLMLSGIGPADHLAALGIPVRQDLPVGARLQDHLRMTAVWSSDVDSLRAGLTSAAYEQYLVDGTGPYSSNVGETAGFIRSTPGASAPDLQISGVPAVVGPMFGVTANGVALAGWLTNPTSVGQLTLRDADPTSMPRIRHDYLTTEHDRRITCDGLRRMAEIADQPAFRAVCVGEPLSMPDSRSDEDILAWVRRSGVTAHHPCGTCAIGSVVDPRLAVLGVEGLRVVDASVMPSIVGANINAATIMIAEKAADMVRRLTVGAV